jgi:uncharacterized membrane protein YccC
MSARSVETSSGCGRPRYATLARVEGNPLHDELRQLAEQIAAGRDDVADLGAEVAAVYRQERQAALDQVGISAFLRGQEEIDENDPRLVAVRERLRDRLRSLLAWARQTGRM